jgi:hypothetical protein
MGEAGAWYLPTRKGESKWNSLAAKGDPLRWTTGAAVGILVGGEGERMWLESVRLQPNTTQAQPGGGGRWGRLGNLRRAQSRRLYSRGTRGPVQSRGYAASLRSAA